MLHDCNNFKRSLEFLNDSTLVASNGNVPSHERGDSSSRLGQGAPTRRFLNFFVASRYRNGRSMDFPKTGNGTTQWQSISRTGHFALSAIFRTQFFQGGNGNKSVMIKLAIDPNIFMTEGR